MEIGLLSLMSSMEVVGPQWKYLQVIAGELNKSKTNEIGLLMNCIVYAQTLDHFDELEE